MKIHSIFQSISGEAGLIPQGAYCTFIRLQGCNLRCAYCDTKDTWPQGDDHGTSLSVVEVIEAIRDVRNMDRLPHALITGGEPLLQGDEVRDLTTRLLNLGYTVQIETNGTFPPFMHHPALSWVMDYKGPSSGQVDQMPSPETMAKWFPSLAARRTFIKFVIKNEKDANHAIQTARTMRSWAFRGWFVFSPLGGEPHRLRPLFNMVRLTAPDLAGQVIFSLQIHKIAELA